MIWMHVLKIALTVADISPVEPILLLLGLNWSGLFRLFKLKISFDPCNGSRILSKILKMSLFENFVLLIEMTYIWLF